MIKQLLIAVAATILATVIGIIGGKVLHRLIGTKPVRKPHLMAFEVLPGVIYAAESAQQALDLYNDTAEEETDDIASVRQLEDHELDAVVQLVGEPTDPDACSTLREELELRREWGTSGPLCGAELD